MKNIINIFLLSFSCILFTGCSDDDSKGDVIVNLIQSTENLIQPPVGGSGKIVLISADGVAVSSSEDWCTYTISGNTVTFNAAYNPSSESRNATIFIKKGEQQQQVSILQDGEILDLNKDRLIVRQSGKTTAGTTLELIVRTNVPFSVKPNESWINYTIKDDSIVLITPTVSTNNRRGSVTVYLTSNPNHQKTATILQFNPSTNDLAGDWDFTYTNISNVRTTAKITMIKASNNGFKIENFPYPPSPTGLAVVGGYLNLDNGNINLPITQETGRYTSGSTNLYGYLCVYDNTNDYVLGSPSPAIQLPGILEYFDDENGISYTFPVDKGIAMGASIDSFLITLFSKPKDDKTGEIDFNSMMPYFEKYTNVVLKKR